MTPERALEILKANEETKIVAIYNSVKRATIFALEKQIPKKPLPIRDVRSGRIVSFTCPNCNHTDLGNNEYRFNCCEDCGQALDWSDTE